MEGLKLFYTDLDDNQCGPVSVEELAALAVKGVVDEETMVFGLPDQTGWELITAIPPDIRDAVLKPVAPAPAPGPPPLPPRTAPALPPRRKGSVGHRDSSHAAAPLPPALTAPTSSAGGPSLGPSVAAVARASKARRQSRTPSGRNLLAAATASEGSVSPASASSRSPRRPSAVAAAAAASARKRSISGGRPSPRGVAPVAPPRTMPTAVAPAPTPVPAPAAAAPTPDPVVRRFSRRESKRFNAGFERPRSLRLSTAGGPPPPVEGWAAKFTVEGVVYYHNVNTGQLSWEKPDCLRTAADAAVSYAPGRIVKTLGPGRFTCELRDARGTIDVKLPPGETELLPLKLSSLVTDVNDLVMLDDLNEAMILHCLRDRFSRDQIYTWVGAGHSVLISMNPFKRLPIYTPGVIAEHARPPPNKRLEPHVFDIAAACHRSLQQDSSSQCILISGESGAGKTEAAKQCLAYLADVAGSESNVEQKLLNSNPVLEAFGNAKTLRNNNSSRFGKWVEYYFQRGSHTAAADDATAPVGRGIVGATITNYLLERSRVAQQMGGERNYHVFYQLCASSRTRESLRLGDASSYRYLNQAGCTTVPGIDDVADCDEMMAALASLGFGDDDVTGTFELVAAVLLLGEFEFTPLKQGSQLADLAVATQPAAFLGVDPDVLAKAVCKKTSMAGKREAFEQLLSPLQARTSTDALAKAIYGRLFDWLVVRINEAVAVTGSSSSGRGGAGAGAGRSGGAATSDLPFIGVLDIFGFEIFESNSFEQLCINYANEKLQQHFNKHTFKEEQEVYVQEAIPVPAIDFIDNQPVLDFIEKRPNGVLVLLDDEIRMPGGSDKSFVEKIHKAHSRKPCLLHNPLIRYTCGFGFCIAHYAGEVKYEGDLFLAKNKDSLPASLEALMATTTKPLLRKLFPAQDPTARSGKRGFSVSGKFRSQLDRLMTALQSTNPHYIRCIKTSPNKRPDDFTSPMCLEQLHYSGVFEAVDIRKKGYPFRLPHKTFAYRFGCISPAAQRVVREATRRKTPMDWPTVCNKVVAASGQAIDGIVIGKTLAFYRADQHRTLELMRNLALEPLVLLIQRIVRGSIARRFCALLREVVPAVQAAIVVGNDVDMLDAALASARAKLGRIRFCIDFEPSVLARGRDLRDKLIEWRHLAERIEPLLSKPVTEVYLALGAAVARAEQIMDIPHTPAHDQVVKKAREALDACASVRLDPEANEALWVLDVDRMRAVTDEAAKYAYTSDDIEEILRILALPEVDRVKMQLRRAHDLNDPVRQISREIRLQDLHLETFAPMYSLSTYPRLRDSYDFGSGMLSWTDSVVPTSLTQLPKAEASAAVQLFKSLLTYCGERRTPERDRSPIAAELINQVTAGSESIKSEFLLQLMKQLTRNPTSESTQRVTDMLALCVVTFRLPEAVEAHVLVFINQIMTPDNCQRFKTAIHTTKYDGPNARLANRRLQASEITNIKNSVFRSTHRSRYSTGDVIASTTATDPSRRDRPAHARVGAGAGAGVGVGSPMGLPASSVSPAALAHAREVSASRATQRRESALAGREMLQSALSYASSRNVAGGGAAAAAVSGARRRPLPTPPTATATKPLMVRALYDFADDDDPDALAFRAGQTFEVLDKEGASGWWKVSLNGMVGLVPSNYVEQV